MKDIKLYIGCAMPPIHRQHLQIIDDTWTLIDLYVDHPSVVKMDARKLEYPDKSVAKIYTSHLLEHFGLWEIEPILKEWNRVLVQGGQLILNVPDMEWAAYELISLQAGNPPKSPVFNTEKKIMEIFYGNQDHEGEFHKSGYTVNSLTQYLESCGFGDIKIKQIYEAHEMGCLISTAIKL